MTNHLVDAPSPLMLPNQESLPDDFVLPTKTDETRESYFNGSRCRTGSGADVVLFPPNKKPIPLSYHVDLLCTNNIAEYEAFTASLRAALALNVKHIHIYGDSQLIIRHVT